MKIGYARVSAADQDLAVQDQQLKDAGCELVFSEKKSGTTRAAREELETALKVLRPGDALVVTRLDRLARSLEDLLAISKRIKERKGSLEVLKQKIDTSTPTGEMFFHLLGAFAQFETALRRERQAEGIAKAKAQGKHLGRPSTVPGEAIRVKLAEGLSVGAIHKVLGVPRTSIYRVRDAMHSEVKAPG